MSDYQQISDNNSVYVTLKDVPAMMQDMELNEFCSVFGTVKSITRSTTNKAHATIQYNNQGFYDQIPIEEDGSHARTDSLDVLIPFRCEDLWRNEKFLSDLLAILVNETKDQEPRDAKPNDEKSKVKEPRDENQNVVDSLESDSLYLECTYCFSVADYLCERCRSPYCSPKCQLMDWWLQHKKTCSKVN